MSDELSQKPLFTTENKIRKGSPSTENNEKLKYTRASSQNVDSSWKEKGSTTEDEKHKCAEVDTLSPSIKNAFNAVPTIEKGESSTAQVDEDHDVDATVEDEDDELITPIGDEDDILDDKEADEDDDLDDIEADEYDSDSTSVHEVNNARDNSKEVQKSMEEFSNALAAKNLSNDQLKRALSMALFHVCNKDADLSLQKLISAREAVRTLQDAASNQPTPNSTLTSGTSGTLLNDCQLRRNLSEEKPDFNK